MRARALVLGSVLVSSACAMPPETVWLRLDLPPELAGREQEAAVAPRIAEAARRAGRGVLALELKRAAGRVRVLLPGACPLEVDASTLPSSPPASHSLRQLFDVGTSERVVGVGRGFEIRALPNCAEARDMKATLAVTGGAPLEDVSVTDGGRLLRARTRAALPPSNGSPGIMAVSAQEQRALRSELSLRVEPAPGLAFEQRLGVAAVARSSGLPNVGLSHPVLLAGSSWRLARDGRRASVPLRARSRPT